MSSTEGQQRVKSVAFTPHWEAAHCGVKKAHLMNQCKESAGGVVRVQHPSGTAPSKAKQRQLFPFPKGQKRSWSSRCFKASVVPAAHAERCTKKPRVNLVLLLHYVVPL